MCTSHSIDLYVHIYHIFKSIYIYVFAITTALTSRGLAREAAPGLPLAKGLADAGGLVESWGNVSATVVEQRQLMPSGESDRSNKCIDI